jgi:hypothetical protein
MLSIRTRATVSIMVVACTGVALTAPAAQARALPTGHADQHGWHASVGRFPDPGYQMVGVKIDDHRVMWIGGDHEDPADNDRTFIYDIRWETFREAARIPAAKIAGQTAEHGSPLNWSSVGVLSDGSVVVAGGQPGVNATQDAATKLSYRYDPARNRWTRTGDLPEPAGWVGAPTLRLADGRLLAAGGTPRNGTANGSGAATRRAFIYDPRRATTVDEVDPDSGQRTGRRVAVQGAWDYTRTRDGRESMLSEGHGFGNEVLLADGRVLVAGGHTVWKFVDGKSVTSTLSTHTDFFDPRTGAWTQGPPLPVIPGEDDSIPNSHGGRANGVCMSALRDGKVVVAGGATQTDGTDYFATVKGRQSILVLTPATNPARSQFRVSPNSIPSGKAFGAYAGGPGRIQLPCYGLSGDRVLIAGGQSDVGEDLYDTYVFDPNTYSVRRGPDMLHDVATWAADFGYPVGYQCATLSTLEVNMHSSLLVFPGDVLVHGGSYNGVTNGDSVPYVEQLDGLGPRGH